jgi:hypothetical protein
MQVIIAIKSWCQKQIFQNSNKRINHNYYADLFIVFNGTLVLDLATSVGPNTLHPV